MNFTNINFSLFTLLFLLTVLSAACVNDLKDIEAIDRPVDNVDRFKNIKLSYSDSARIRVVINAAAMESRYDHNRLQSDNFPEGVQVEFFDDLGRPSSWLSARKANRFPSKNLVVVRDSVVLYNVEGDTLRTDELFWNSKDGNIYTERSFRYSKKNGERIFGRKFKSDQGFKEYSFEQMSGQIRQVIPQN